MVEFTLKQLKEIAKFHWVVDLTHASDEEIQKIEKEENGLEQVGYSCGAYGCNGKMFRGRKNSGFYVIAGTVSNLFRI